jgi:hypothetical protein
LYKFREKGKYITNGQLKINKTNFKACRFTPLMCTRKVIVKPYEADLDDAKNCIQGVLTTNYQATLSESIE